MIHSHLVYCINVYSCANKTSLNKLRVKQKEAIRIICNVGHTHREHTAPLFTQLKILPVDQLINLNVLKFMHSFTHNKLPVSFYRMWTIQIENVIRIESFVMLTSYTFQPTIMQH
jgi:hypothetical protein